MVRAYRYTQSAEDPGEAVNVIRARALMISPGIPDFMTRDRLVGAGPVTLAGKAWAGHGGVLRVEISVDSRASWCEAELGESGSPHAWRTWTFAWNAAPAHTFSLSAPAMPTAMCSRSISNGTSAAMATTACSVSKSSCDDALVHTRRIRSGVFSAATDRRRRPVNLQMGRFPAAKSSATQSRARMVRSKFAVMRVPSRRGWLARVRKHVLACVSLC
jgi:hypothetical protein